MVITYPAVFTDVKNNILIEVPDLEILKEANSEEMVDVDLTAYRKKLDNDEPFEDEIKAIKEYQQGKDTGVDFNSINWS